MSKKESDKMATTTPRVSMSKKQRILEEAHKKYEDSEKVEGLFHVGGKLYTSHNFDAVKVSKELRGKD